MSGSQPENSPEDFESMWELLEQSLGYLNPSRGDIREGVILKVRPDEVIIDIGAKQDAILSPREWQKMTPEEKAALHEGDRVLVYVLRFDDRTGILTVSLKLAQEHKDWVRAEELLESGEIVTVTITGFNKGGLLCPFGSLQGFVPASQVVDLLRRTRERTQMEALAKLVGEEMAVKVIEVNRRRRRLILSERAAQREWRAQQRERLLEELEVGEIRTGVVSNLCDFGAFVDLGGLDGLVHLSELSWGHVSHPSDVLEVGQQVQVLVLNVDRERQRVGLSIKRIQPDPWAQAAEKYRPGELVTGVVTRLAQFGAFVELEPGVEGLIHLSELAEGNVTDPSQVVHEGEQVTALVLAVDPGEHRLSLSLRQVPRPPEASGRPEDLSEGEVSSEEMEEVEERQSEDGLQG